MKYTKKILAFILGVLMLFSCVIPVSAEATSKLSVGNVTGEAGSSVIVPITVDQNSGFVSLSMYLTYDTSALTLIAVHDTGLISGGYHSPYYDSPYYLSWINDERTTNYTSTGLIVELEFLIDEDAKNQDYPIIVRMNTDGALDKNGNEVTFTLNSGKVTVAESEHVCSFGDWKKQNSKKHARVCSECGEYEEEKHNWNDGEVIEEPSCGVDGEILYTCEDCGYEDYEWIDAEPHDYGDWKPQSADEHVRICSNCGDEDVEDHNWILSGNVLECDDCHETKVHTHSFVEFYTYAPTCTESGYTEYKCEGCGEMKQDNYISALGHDYVNGVCKRCGAVSTNPTPVTGITLSETNVTMEIGDGKWIDATVLPGNATNQLVIWESSDTSIVDIAASGDNNQRGLAVARANGTAIITATTADGGFVARCVVTVSPNPHDHKYSSWEKYSDSQHKRECSCGYSELAEHRWDEGIMIGMNIRYSCLDCSAMKTVYSPVPEERMSVVISSHEALAGETIQVTVSLENNPGLASAILNVSFDTSILTLQSVEYNTAMGGQTVPPQSMNSPVTLYWVSPFADMSEDCVFATLTFKVSENAKEGDNTKVNITYEADNVYNLAEENIALNVMPGTVAVIDYIPGDINGDGVLNNKDVTRLMQYFAGWDVTVNTPALDVNNDGSHNNKDVTRLMQYLAGWDVEIH